MKRLVPFAAALLASFAPDFALGQTLQFGNLNVAQTITGGVISTAVAADPGGTAGFTIGTANAGAYDLNFGNASDTSAGVVIASVSQNGRDNRAVGEAYGLFYATTTTSKPDQAGDAARYQLGVRRAAQGHKANMNVGFAYFPFSKFLAGHATNSVNNAAIDALVASPGIALGTQFLNTSTKGVYTLDLNGLGGSSATGVLLVSGGKDEDNFALSGPNADGTFTIVCHDNGANGAGGEADPVVFAYIPTSMVGTNNLVAIGRVNSDASTDVAAGTFTVTKGGTGQWYLQIPGHSPATGTLLFSHERGVTNMPDNIASAQWDAANARWTVQSYDMSGDTALPTLQNGATNAEDVFSFAFFSTAAINQPPTVTLTAPATATRLVQDDSVTLTADASDSDGTVAKVEFFDGATSLGSDTTEPYSLSVSALALGRHTFLAKAADDRDSLATSASSIVTVTPPAGTGGLFFDGAAAHVTFGNNPAFGLASFTLECWFRRDGSGLAASSGSGGVSVYPLISHGRGESDGSNIDCNYLFGIEASSGKLAADFEDMATGLNHPAVGATVVPRGVWQHGAVTFDATTHEWRLYLNGGLESVVSTDGQVPRSDSIQHAGIAAAFDSKGVPAGAFLGALDEVRVWNYARSQSEIQLAINTEIASTTGLVGRWAMSEGSGDTLTSTASAAIAGSLVNQPTWVTGAPFDINVLPSVAITAPSAGTTFTSPATFDVEAAASDTDGSIAQVEFLRNGAVVATQTAAPFRLPQTLSAGQYTFAARATDDRGAVKTSAPVGVLVQFDPAHPPANTALSFDGVDDYVTMGTAPTLGVGADGFTIECWFRRDGDGITSGSGSGGVTGVPLFGKGRGENDGGTMDCDYFFGINPTGQLVADFETYPATGLTSGQNYPVIGTNSPISYGVWHHAAATYDATAATWALYLDGANVGTKAVAAGARPRFDSAQHFGIATALNTTGTREGAFAGVIDEVRVWNYARSAAEIAAAKDQEIGSATGLVGRYGLNEAFGNSVANSAATDSAPLGTLNGNPLWVDGAPFASANSAPTVALTTPTTGATTVYPYAYALAADAADSDGSVARVEFYVGEVKVGAATTAPFTVNWEPPAVGDYPITARAIDNLGTSATSAAVTLTVEPNPNQPPVVTPNAPTAGSVVSGTSIELAAHLADPEGDGATVTFYGRRTVPATPGPDFTIMTLPDTQYYSENTGGNRFPQFLDQTNWIVSQRDLRNIAFVSHMGDIVDDGDSISQQWVNANQAMAQLEDHATTLRAYGIPFGAAPGNHDQSTNGNPESISAYYNQYFGVARYVGRPYWGGNYGANNDNNYQLFSASGLDFIIIHLEYRTAADPAVIAWADALLKAHPHRRGIVTSHWIIGGGNPGTWGGQGKGIYDGLKNNPNLFLLLCGHIHAEGRRTDVFEGRTIYTALQDYQSLPNGGSGFLRTFRFSPADNKIYAESYSPTLDRAPAASDGIPSFAGPFAWDYDMQHPVSDWVPLGTATVAPGATTATLTWFGLEPGADYEWYAVAHDGINEATGATSRFATAATVTPTITLAGALDGVTYSAPTTFTLHADATAGTGNIARVEFYQGLAKIAVDTEAPYECTTAALATGSYTFSAVVANDRNQVKLSNIVNVTVADRINSAPTIALTAPSDPAIVTAPAIVTLAADAADTDGAIAKVEFFVDGTLLGTDLAAPYSLEWSADQSGSYALTAVATDNEGVATVSAPVTLVARRSASAAQADADSDALPALLEYALGTADTVPGHDGQPTLGTVEATGALTLTFLRAHAELTYTVQSSDDLENWSILATNPGEVGQPVTVTDQASASTTRYLRLVISDGANEVRTVPVGRITYTLTQGRETSLSFPLLLPVGSIGGRCAGVLDSVGTNTLDDNEGGWSAGELSQPAAPYLLRLTSGTAAGRTFTVSTTAQNTATQLTLVTDGVDLTSLGLQPGVDTYELVPADTLASLFPAGKLLSGSVATGDNLRLWNGATWLVYYHDGANWRRQGAGLADNVVVRPDQAWMLARRGTTLSISITGTVPAVGATTQIKGKATNALALLPLRRTFAQFPLQNLIPGWTSNPASPASGDIVRIWNGTGWITYYHSASGWMRQGAGSAENTMLLEPGRPVLVVRPAAANGTMLSQTATY